MTDETQTMEDVMSGDVQEVDTQAAPQEEQIEADAVDSSPQPDAQEDDTEQKAQDGVQKRINKLTAEKYAARREADELAQKLAEIESKAKPIKEPNLEDFDYDEEKHNEALIAYQVQAQIKAEREALEQQQAQTQAQQKAADFAAKEAEFALVKPDYMEVVQNMPQLPSETFDAITSLSNGAEVAYHLAKNLDVAVEIAALPPHIAALKLGQIAAKVTPSAKKIEASKAPAPVETLKGSASVNKGVEDMSMDELMRM